LIKWHAAGKLRIEAEGNLRERSSNEKKKDSGGLSAVAGVLEFCDDRKSLRVDGVILISDSHAPAESFFDPAAAFRSFA